MNKVIMTGRLCQDCEVKYTSSQMAIVNVNLAVQRNKKGETDFPRITIFGKQAENVALYTKKGNMVLVEGRVQTRTYDDKNGNKVHATDIIAERVEFLESKNQDRSPKPTENPRDSFVEVQEQFPW